MVKADISCDVLIIGAGMAGGCLARQLRFEQPDLKIVVIDAKEEFSYWVGESTIEVFDDYAIRNLRIGPYLLSRQIPKHGLRFWFDSKEKNLPIVELSEQGRSRYTVLNRGAQINRATFDRDLCEMNREIGIEVLLNTRVLTGSDTDGLPDIEIDRETGHTVRTTAGTFHCKYLVDAGGRSSPLARKLKLVPQTPDTPYPKGSYWSRFEGCHSIDDMGDESWRRRVDFTLRWASTNHFMYDGYWIWLIPVSEKIVSIGVTFDIKSHDFTMKSGENLLDFLRQHRALSELLGDQARPLDFFGIKPMERGARQFFSMDRWYLTGMSGIFVDPLFSSTSGQIALSNSLISQLIAADKVGDTVRLERRLRHFNIIMRNIYLRQIAEFSNYHRLGSFDAFVNWQTLRYHSILNYEVPLKHADYVPLMEKIDSHDDNCGCRVGAFSESQQLGFAGDRIADEFVKFIDCKDQYYARNRDCFHEKTERPATRKKTVELDFGEAVLKESLLNWEAFFRYYIVRMCEIEGIPFDEETFSATFRCDWNTSQTLAEVFDALRCAADSGKKPTSPEYMWDLKGPIDPSMAEVDPWWCRFVTSKSKTVL